MKNKKCHTVDTTAKSNIKIVERGKFDTCNAHVVFFLVLCLVCPVLPVSLYCSFGFG